MKEFACPLPRKVTRQAGFTLVELMVGSALTAILMVASARLLRDYQATAKTMRVAADADALMLRLLGDIRRLFQASPPMGGGVRRACVLDFERPLGSNDPNDFANPKNYVCRSRTNDVAATAGIGFDLNASEIPQVMFVNACEPYAVLPAGSGGPLTPPLHPTQIRMWGGTAGICPQPCAARTRPAIKFLSRNATSVDILQRQVPLSIEQRGPSALNLWGAVLCAKYFVDVQKFEQGLFGQNVGASPPDYMTVSVFLARGRFDSLAPVDNTVKPPVVLSNYVWMHGGLTLDFAEIQEMTLFKCPAPGVAPRPAGC